MTLKRLLLLAGVLFSFNGYLMSQTSLNAGDLAIISVDVQGSTDEFAFVCFVDLEPGTEIYFTDEDADNDNTFNIAGPDGLIKYTAPAAGLPKGTVVPWVNDTALVLDEFENITSTLQFPDGGSFPGDAVFAYQGSGNTVTTWLHLAGKFGFWGTLPTAIDTLKVGYTGNDGEYNGLRNSSKNTLFSAINDSLNWNTSSGVGVSPLNLTEFRVGYYWNGVAWEPEDPNNVTPIDDDIIIAGSGATLSGNTTTNGNVIIDTTGTFDLGSFTLTADTVFVEADTNGQGQVMGDISGTVQFQSFLSAPSARWFNVGSPVGGTLSDMQFSQGGFINTLADGDSANVNIYWYNTDLLNSDPGNSEGTWMPVANKNALADTAGYSVYLGSPFGSVPMKVITHGTLNNGTVNTDVSTANGGWNFVNNPYATSIDWDLVTADNADINETYYIYDDDTGDKTYVGYNSGAGGLPGGVVGVNQYIGPGQAFFVNAGTASQIDFMSSQQTMTEPVSLYRSQPNPGLYLVAQTGSSVDYTYVGLKAGVSDSYDKRHDGKKMMNTAPAVPSMYSKLQGEDYMFKFIDDNFTKRTVPVHFEMSNNTQVDITAEIRNIDPNWFVHLEDKLTGQFTNLRYDTYTFSHEKTNDPGRFVLHLNKSSVGLDEMGESKVYAYLQNGNLQVNLEGLPGSKTFDVQLYDVSGRLIGKQSFNGGQISTMNFEQRSNGVYVMKVLDDGSLVHTQKVMNY